MKDNRFFEPVKILAFSLFFLLLISLFKQKYLEEKFGFKQLDLLSDVRMKAPVKRLHFISQSPASDSPQIKQNIPLSELGFEPILEFKNEKKEGGLQKFIRALIDFHNKKRKKVRIGYFGDSMIEGDLITQDIRQKLQDYFGGDGVGFVPLTSIVAPFRQTVRSEFSDNWKEDNFLVRTHGKILPPSGHSFYPGTEDWTSFASFPQKHLNVFHEVNFLYGPVDSTASLFFENHEYPLQGKAILNQLVLAKDTSIKKFTLRFQTGKTPLFGVCMESETGVFLDNYSFRGVSGTELQKVPLSLYQSWNELHPLDLIVLHYGPNLLYKPEQTDFSYYQKLMSRTIRYIQSAFPNASILIVSSADKSCRNNGSYETAPGVEPLVLVQENLAKENNCAFWNLYLAMGGENSMKRFAEEKPVLAHTDYTHFNLSGSHWVARRLHKALMKKYNETKP